MTDLRSVAVKKSRKLDVSIGLQKVLLPAFAGDIIPLSKPGKELGVG